jgi:hypothetical protein
VENWITRIVATFCALGSAGLFWTLGVFVVVPWREGRMLALNGSEIQVIGLPLLLGLATAWGALHIFALADKGTNPKTYAVIRVLLVIGIATALFGGMAWTQARLA